MRGGFAKRPTVRRWTRCGALQTYTAQPCYERRCPRRMNRVGRAADVLNVSPVTLFASQESRPRGRSSARASIHVRSFDVRLSARRPSLPSATRTDSTFSNYALGMQTCLD